MDTKTHWEKVYTTKAPDAVSWYRPHLETSLALIVRAADARSASIIDIGGGESTLVDDLLAWGYENITVLDVSQTDIEVPEQRVAYVRNVAHAVRPGGHVIVSTFGPEGPTKCSGLDVIRYDAESLHDQFGVRFRLVESSKELHRTPFGTTQQFLFCYCKVE